MLFEKLLGSILIGLNLVLYAGYFFKKGKTNQAFVVYLFFLFIINVIAVTLGLMKQNNLFFSHLYFNMQLITLSCFFYTLEFNETQKRIVKWVGMVIPAILLINYIVNPKTLFRFNTLEVFMTNIPLIVYCLFHFYNSIGQKMSYKYIISGMLVFFSFNTIIFCSGNLINSLEVKVSRFLWDVNSFLTYTFQILISWEWFQGFYRKTSK